MNQTFMKEKKILPLVLSMALPMVISMAVNSLYNIVDSYFVASSVMELALSYSNLAFLFAPFITVGIGYEKIFQAVGHMRETMVSMVLGFVTNIVLDPLLIFGIGFFPEMGMRGAALATGI